ncbi:glutamate-5-semialdehyde dehydrogenase [Candidatus Viadribacter manganicus]|uniref:Gamma-glutamyl phosphate reductase n=1 Tax=Candidatus Viadribacter manganicus TaxID=1759059 RepID=A0A1B1AI18_9PROT|nr:glutamate-5-semialdehyde dehydrogenase [Candidatus Viadribacter manganicus]ANP46180.1 gamma-glutamyl-phosphate reductase [Candidatus Viadribacter manganicus]
MSALEAEMMEIGRRARAAAHALRLSSPEARTATIEAMAHRLRTQAGAIATINAGDVEAATRKLPNAQIDRLRFDTQGIEAVADGVAAIARQPDPVDAVLAEWTRPNGLRIERIRTPIGVIGMIFESRPNVAADAGALAIRSGNAVILRGGSESAATNAAIIETLRTALRERGLPEDAIQGVPTSDRAAVGMMLAGLDGAIDVIVPRGGKSLVARVQNEARVPVFAHLEGICHTYVHADADPAKAKAIAVNAKMRRVSVCGATETLLIDKAVADALLPPISIALHEAGCQLRGDGAAQAIIPMDAATEEDWSTEYLAPILSVRVVDGIAEAIAHIARYGSQHTEAIITENAAAAERFLREVDSAIVVHNASTQFADGGEFGFGGEIGIATGRLHARGPVGAEQLTTFKYVVRGDGQTRP